MLAVDASFGLLLISLALLAAIIVGYFVIRRVRSQMTSGPAAEEPFTLQDLREMRASGQITPAEYEAMRGALLGRVIEDGPRATEKPGLPQPPGDA